MQSGGEGIILFWYIAYSCEMYRNFCTIVLVEYFEVRYCALVFAIVI